MDVSSYISTYNSTYFMQFINPPTPLGGHHFWSPRWWGCRCFQRFFWYLATAHAAGLVVQTSHTQLFSIYWSIYGCQIKRKREQQNQQTRCSRQMSIPLQQPVVFDCWPVFGRSRKSHWELLRSCFSAERSEFQYASIGFVWKQATSIPHNCSNFLLH